ncbi:hypothetical protein LMH87_006743 [Akanthomyces muscarius]|uniref:Uncharacterized protein n=1 Tax=Akanthomyces muscarius TaxID=2231603 RepID=A0A9W8QQV1_AKAMU|nr:hypothetical protein LMH87_006743 [Akanthomyces muscarius]KAJ4165096.1 hypothetical protein LMH87_006743 [Akanthomyces muscarius]
MREEGGSDWTGGASGRAAGIHELEENMGERDTDTQDEGFKWGLFWSYQSPSNYWTLRTSYDTVVIIGPFRGPSFYLYLRDPVSATVIPSSPNLYANATIALNIILLRPANASSSLARPSTSAQQYYGRFGRRTVPNFPASMRSNDT